MTQRGSARISPVVGVAVTAGMLLAGVFAVLRTRVRDTAPSPAPSAEQVLEGLLAGGPAQAASAAPGSGKRIPEGASLPEAIDAARPHFANTVGRLDVGSALLATWASEHMEWDALQSLPETTPALFRKDPEAERGKRLCVTGTISQIRAEKSLARRLTEDRAEPLIERPTTAYDPLSPSGSGSAAPIADLALDPWLSEDWSLPRGAKVFFALVVVKTPGSATDPAVRPSAAALRDQLVVEVIASKSTGNLVDGSDATACGVLTSVTLPPAGAQPAGLGDTPQHRIVGLFDLPENHAHAAAPK